jgi:hypothetical protein
MIEYGHTTEQGSGQVGGGGSLSGGGGGDMGATAMQWVNDSVETISALPAETLVLLAIVVLAGLVLLKRAF